MTDSKTTEVFEQYGQYVSPHKAATWSGYGIDFVMGRREGVYAWSLDGAKRLLNCHVNGGTFNLGHRHPALVRALQQAADSLDIGNHHFISAQRAELAARLAAITPGDIQYTIFGVGGGEAIDCAIKVARGSTRRLKIVSAFGAYHGHTGLALAAGEAKYREPFGPLPPGFVQIPFNDVEALAAAVDRDTAAVIFETVPATLGMPIPAREFYPAVREICDRTGALFIADEVQTGLGRTGRMWGVDCYGVVPDILVTAKGLSGGMYPISATCLRPPLMDFFRDDPFIHVSTFGGAEIGCAVALAMLDIVTAPGFLGRGQRAGRVVRDRARGPAPQAPAGARRGAPARSLHRPALLAFRRRAVDDQALLRRRHVCALRQQRPLGAAVPAAAGDQRRGGSRDDSHFGPVPRHADVDAGMSGMRRSKVATENARG